MATKTLRSPLTPATLTAPATDLASLIAAAVAAALAGAAAPAAPAAPAAEASASRAVPTVELRDGVLVIRLKLGAATLSSTGKMLMMAATGWTPCGITLPGGKKLRINLSAGCYANER